MKKIFLLFFFVLLYSKDYAWIQTFGDRHSDTTVEDIIQTKNGYIILSKSNFPNIQNDYDYLLLKLNKNGKIIKKASYGTALDDYPFKILKTENGYLCVGFANIYKDSRSIDNGYLVKINDNLDKLWEKNYKNIRLYSGTSTKNGFLLVGSFFNKNTQNFMPIIIKIDKQGNIKWKKKLDFFYFDSAAVDIKKFNNKYIIIGNGQRLRDFNGDILQENFSFLIKIDKNGKILDTYKSEKGILFNKLATINNSILILGEKKPDYSYLRLTLWKFSENNIKEVLSWNHDSSAGSLTRYKKGLLITGTNFTKNGYGFSAFVIKIANKKAKVDNVFNDKNANIYGEKVIESIEKDGYIVGLNNCVSSDITEEDICKIVIIKTK